MFLSWSNETKIQPLSLLTDQTYEILQYKSMKMQSDARKKTNEDIQQKNRDLLNQSAQEKVIDSANNESESRVSQRVLRGSS